MIPILLLFFIFTWGVGYFDPTTKDDINIDLKDDCSLCDLQANDAVYSGCYELTNANVGAWMVDIKAFKDSNVVGENSSAFIVGASNDSLQNGYIKQASGSAPPVVSTDKTSYEINGQVKIYAQLKEGNNATAVLNNGTHFYVDLPFTVPIFNFKRINEVYWWFIIVVLIFGLLLSMLINKVEPLKKWLS